MGFRGPFLVTPTEEGRRGNDTGTCHISGDRNFSAGTSEQRRLLLLIWIDTWRTYESSKGQVLSMVFKLLEKSEAQLYLAGTPHAVVLIF